MTSRSPAPWGGITLSFSCTVSQGCPAGRSPGAHRTLLYQCSGVISHFNLSHFSAPLPMLPGSPPESTTCTPILASDVLLGFPDQDSKIWNLPPHLKPVSEEAPVPCPWFLSLVKWTVKLHGGRIGQNLQGLSFPSLLPSLAPGGLPGPEHVCENNCRWWACEEGFVSWILINGELSRWAPLGWEGSSNPLGCWP